MGKRKWKPRETAEMSLLYIYREREKKAWYGHFVMGEKESCDKC